jgi:hypothetical protein
MYFVRSNLSYQVDTLCPPTLYNLCNAPQKDLRKVQQDVTVSSEGPMKGERRLK